MARQNSRVASIEDIDLSGRRVFIRVDFNCPLDEGRVADDTRIQRALPTIEYARKAGAKVILASHLGRPKGRAVPELSMVPVGERLAELLQTEVIVPDEPVGDASKKLVQNLRDGQVLLLENLRFHPGERKNDDGFARSLAALCDVYINDAFGTAHRAHASVEALPRLMRDKAAGFLMHKEITALTELKTDPARPFVAVLGGAKVSDKIGVINHLITKVDRLVIGGAMAYTFWAAAGVSLGRSLVEEDKIDLARRIALKAEARNVELLLPNDHVVVEDINEKAAHEVASNEGFPASGIAVDIGPRSILRFRRAIEDAKTVFWNGPMGIFEMDAFAEGTNQIANAIAHAQCHSVVGGGDSVAALKKTGLTPFITHVSTGGGASLAMIEGKDMPGIESLLSTIGANL